MRAAAAQTRASLAIVLGAFLISSIGGGIEKAAAQALASLPPPISIDVTQLQYSSPYGPRAISGAGYQFHKGVDYRYGLGTPIHAVEAGTIDKLDYEGQAGWLMSIQGTQRFAYLHLFDDSWLAPGPLPTDDEGNPIFAKSTLDLGGGKSIFVTLEGLNTGPGPFKCFAIIFWEIFAKNQSTPGFVDIPIVGFSPCDGQPIGNAMFGFVTQNTVPQGAIIAPVGHSGAAAAGGAHLHLQVNSRTQNPLLYVQHDHSDAPAYEISISKDKGDPTSTVALDANRVELKNEDGPVLDPAQDSPLILRAEVNYATSGHDLDEVQIFMYAEGTPQPDLIEFNYGGTGSGRNISELHCSTDFPCDVIQQGVYPQLHHGGVVNFLSDPIDLTTLDLGKYVMLVRTFNILGQATEKSITVSILPIFTGAISASLGELDGCGGGTSLVTLSGNLSVKFTAVHSDATVSGTGTFQGTMQGTIVSCPPSFICTGFAGPVTATGGISGTTSHLSGIFVNPPTRQILRINLTGALGSSSVTASATGDALLEATVGSCTNIQDLHFSTGPIALKPQ